MGTLNRGLRPGSGKEGSMQSPDELRRKIEALEDRISKLSGAIAPFCRKSSRAPAR